MRRFFRIIYYLGGVLLFVLIAIIGYTQTRSFKTYLRNTLLHESNNAINGQLQLGSIEGNLVKGFSIRDVIVSDYVTELLSAESIELKYDLFGFLFKRVAVSYVSIVKPHIHLYRSVDGTWNVARLFKPTPTDTTPSAWTIDIKQLELIDAEVIFTDSLLLHRRQIGEYEVPPESVLDYARVHLYALSLETSLQIQNGRYSAKMKNLSTSIHQDGISSRQIRDKRITSTPAFKLSQLSGDFLLAEDEVSASDVHIETSNSSLRLDAELKGVDLTHVSDVEELKGKHINLSLSAGNIDTKELKHFLYPWVDFLDRKIKLQLKAGGTFDNLKIEQLAIQMPHSLLQLQGGLRNLHHSRDLEMALRANDNFVAPSDLLEHLPGLHLPDLTFLGSVKYSLTYEGRPLDFKAHFIGSTAVGNIDVDGNMKIERKNITYSGIVAVRSLALATILGDEKITSNINAKATIDAAGFNPRTMTGLAKVEIDSSSIYGMPIRRSVFVFDIADGLLRSHLAASVGSCSYEFSSRLKFFQQDSTNYGIIGKIRSLDLAELLKDKQYESDLTFDLTATGAIGASTRSDTTELRFYRSVFQTEMFESAEAKATFQVRDSMQSTLQITSTIGDLNVDGHFTPASFIAAWQNSYQLVTEAVAHRFRSLDSLRSLDRSITAIQKFQPSHVSRITPIGVQFRLNVKDFKPIGAFIFVPLLGQGLVEGEVAGDSAKMRFSGNLNLEQFRVRSGTDTLTVDTASFHYFFDGIGHQMTFETVCASIGIELKNFEINELLFNQVAGQLQVESNSSNFQLSTFIDSTARVDLKGTSRMNTRLMEFDIPEIKNRNRAVSR